LPKRRDRVGDFTHVNGTVDAASVRGVFPTDSGGISSELEIGVTEMELGHASERSCIDRRFHLLSGVQGTPSAALNRRYCAAGAIRD
jgi:hypothetical protein